MTLDQLFVGLWRCRFLLPQDSNPHLTTPHFKTNTPAQAFLLLHNVGTELENDNCIGLKTTNDACAAERKIEHYGLLHLHTNIPNTEVPGI